ncbi:MAG: hypothetical protein U0903_12235 [Planctomycetales bacterium]
MLEVRTLLSASALAHSASSATEVHAATGGKNQPHQLANPVLTNSDVKVGQPWSPVVKVDATGKDFKKPHGHYSFDNNATQSPVEFQHSMQKHQHYIIARCTGSHTYDQPGSYDVYLLMQHGDSYRSLKFTINVTAP